MSIRRKKLPIAALERIDDLCVEFENRLRASQATSIENVIQDLAESAERDVLLAELVVLEVSYRRQRGEAPTIQEYIDRFPKDEFAIQDALKEEDNRKAAFKPPTLDELGKLFPSLQVMEFIGAGGMGAVYKARQEGLDRIVALKILPEEFGHDVKFALRFTREARTLARLNHPNIVSVFEFGNVEETYYFLMEFVDGSTLREIVEARELAPEHALAIVPHLCDALQYAHDHGVVHRDIKPDNILMATDGSVKIVDFGLSRLLENESQQEMLTGTHQVMGTPRYMAPEQFEGARGVDHRADIYSLGVVFYEMLTGELPIGRFAPPSDKVQIDVRLDEVVLRTLEKEPQRRYQRASQLKSDVQAITSGETVLLQGDPEEESKSKDLKTNGTSVEEQELAARLILTRHQLMERVEDSLRPLFRGQIVQILFGVAFILLGAKCWALSMGDVGRLVCGIILHVYGILVIAQAVSVTTRIKRIDYSKPIAEIRGALDSVRGAYLRAGILVGFIWWLMWIPVTVAVGFDAVLYPASLIVSLVVGVIGFLVSVWLFWRAIKSRSGSAEKAIKSLTGESIRGAYLALDEIERARIH